MNNNFYEIPQDWYSEFNNSFINSLNNGIPMNNPNMNNMPKQFNMMNNPNMMNDISSDLANPKLALDRGNLFNRLYEPYKDYKYRPLKANNKKEELLYNILMHNFALTELNLYLDLNEKDTNMLNLYNRYLDNKKRLVNEYEMNFGPLTLDGVNIGTTNFNWNNSPWPWEGTK